MDWPKKSLGQHWLKNQQALSDIVAEADLEPKDTVLEIGPGLGDLTKLLVHKAEKVVAVEIDQNLAEVLKDKLEVPNLEITKADILKFDLTSLPTGYKVVANIPYYLTNNLLRLFTETANKPTLAVLLIQKEVAERLAAKPGQMSILSVSVQLEYEVSLGRILEAKLFEPPPKVDSQVTKLVHRESPLFDIGDKQLFFRVVKAGFSSRRKKLRSSLSAGLQIPKEQAEKILSAASVDENLRAQNLSLEDWHRVYVAAENFKL